jgi:hypothetical protein
MLTLAALLMAAPQASAAGISDGRSLSEACEVLRTTTADGSKAPINDPCRSWLFSFFSAYKEDYDARMAAYLSGMSVERNPEPCFRPPDFISFVDVAGLIVAQGKQTPELLDSPAEALVLQAMSTAYPCETQGDAAHP